MPQKEPLQVKSATEEKGQEKLPTAKELAASYQKSKKKAPVIPEKYHLPLIAIAIVFLACLIYFTFFWSPYTYRFDIDGVQYVSNEYVPTQFFSAFKQNTTVYVSPILTEGVTDSLTFNALNLWQIVLIGNHINTIQLIRVKDTQGNFVYCYTNDGNVFVNRKISLADCTQTLATTTDGVVLMEKSKENKIVLEKNKVTLFSPVENVNAVNFSLIKQIFPNATQLIDIVNEKIYGINS